MFDFDNIDFLYEPYPIGYATSVVERSRYDDLVDTWPETSLFKHMPTLGDKYSLSEFNHREQYFDFLSSTPRWREMYEQVKSPNFLNSLFDLLSRHRIDLPIRGRRFDRHHRFAKLSRRFTAQLKRLRWKLRKKPVLRSRFEFSMMRADQGCIKPHTDSSKKHITLVVSVSGQDEWQSEWGGGTSVLKPRDPRDNFNWQNRQLEFADVDEIHTFPFRPNQCVLFVKTFNSLHCVYNLKGPQTAWRKTLTINIEDAQ